MSKRPVCRLIKIICDNCSEESLRWASQVMKRNFCSRKCYVEHGKKNSNKLKRKCLYCGTTFYVKRCEVVNKKGGKYCSRRCADKGMFHGWNKGKTGEKAPAWKGGLSLEPYGVEFSRELKAKIRARDINQCQVCGIYENGKAHPVHHIDYDKKNSMPENLITLCCGCHRITNGSREYWASYFNQLEKDFSVA